MNMFQKSIFFGLVALVCGCSTPVDETLELGYTVPALPEVRQPNDCAQVAMYTIMANQGYKQSEEVFQRLHGIHRETGSDLKAVVETLSTYVPSAYNSQMGQTGLVNALRAGRPTILVIWMNPDAAKKQGHGVVLTGYRAKNGQKDWQITDARGSFWVSDSQFSKLWTGQAIEVAVRVN